MGWVINNTPRPLYPWERPGTHCIGGWVGSRAGLDGCEKPLPHRDSIPGLCSPQRVARYTYYAISAPPRHRVIRKCSTPWSQLYTVYFFLSLWRLLPLILVRNLIRDMLGAVLLCHQSYTNNRRLSVSVKMLLASSHVSWIINCQYYFCVIENTKYVML
jgi:hypothetical protein